MGRGVGSHGPRHQGVLLAGGGGSDGLDGTLHTGLGGLLSRHGRRLSLVSLPYPLGVASLIFEVVYGLPKENMAI